MYKIGNDIVRISRFENKINNKNFINQLLNEDELNTYNTLEDSEKALFLAKRWCFLESILKMEGKGILNFRNLPRYILVNEKGKKPYVKNRPEIDVSISHEDDYLFISCVREGE